MVDLLFGFSVVSNLERRKSPNVRHKNGKSASHPSTSFAKGAALRERCWCVRERVHVYVLSVQVGIFFVFCFGEKVSGKGAVRRREKREKKKKGTLGSNKENAMFASTIRCNCAIFHPG